MCAAFQEKPKGLNDKPNWRVAYLNAGNINKGAIYPKFDLKNHPDKSPAELAKLQNDVEIRARAEIYKYICDSFLKWQDKSQIILPYQFE